MLRWDEIADPEPGEGQVRIAVHAAGTNPVDAGIRADGTWAGTTLPWVPGYDVAGVIDAVGPGVTDLTPGSRVAAMTQFPRQGGGYAEFAVVDAAEAALLADSVSFVAAAATPLAGGTALEVIERLALPRGARLLVLGASGGVGSFLVQLAARSGIDVVAVGRASITTGCGDSGPQPASTTPAARAPLPMAARTRDGSTRSPTWSAARPPAGGCRRCATTARSRRSRRPSSTSTR